jgi:hypothetical protein|tara:strand:+ start:3146 stop:3361 length:216 start_codon:yes stop_codon:yes gene_type:complete
MADLAQQMLDLASKGPAEVAEADRSALLQASVKLSEALENPLEKFLRLFMVGWPEAFRWSMGCRRMKPRLT